MAVASLVPSQHLFVCAGREEQQQHPHELFFIYRIVWLEGSTKGHPAQPLP